MNTRLTSGNDVTISVSITENTETALTRLLSQGFELPGLKKYIGREVVNALKEHFFERDTDHPNELGGTRTHFYAQAARSLHFSVTGSDVDIATNKLGVLQQLNGGILEPVNGSKYLTIPATPEAYAKRAREIDNLELLFGRRRDGSIGAIGLVEKRYGEATTKSTGKKLRAAKGVKQELKDNGYDRRVFFWFAFQVYQAPDETVLPPVLYIREVAIGAAEEYLGDTIQGTGGQN